jgi:hypothetical protein
VIELDSACDPIADSGAGRDLSPSERGGGRTSSLAYLSMATLSELGLFRTDDRSGHVRVFAAAFRGLGLAWLV